MAEFNTTKWWTKTGHNIIISHHGNLQTPARDVPIESMPTELNWLRTQIRKVTWVCGWVFCLKNDNVINWKHFPRYWSFVVGIHRWPVNSPHKGQWRGALMFSLTCARINSWVNNREAGDLKHHRAHYDVTVMSVWCNYSGMLSGFQPLFSLTHWGRDKMTAIMQTTFSNTFHWPQMYELLSNVIEVCS